MGTVSQNVRCECGVALTEHPNIPANERHPCPQCGSLVRRLEVNITETVRVSSHLSALGEREVEAIGFSESQRDGRITGASIEADGALRVSVQGTSPQGEEDTRAACRVLLERLNNEVAVYSDVQPGTGDVDCVLVAVSGVANNCNVQVVRALVTPPFWQKLCATGSVRKNMSVPDAVAEIEKSIALKANDVKIPPRSRATLVLALDATRLPGLGFDAIVREFRLAKGTWAASVGFKAVWLIGPLPRLCWRLDIISDAAA
jgi:hypothetical protein